MASPSKMAIQCKRIMSLRSTTNRVEYGSLSPMESKISRNCGTTNASNSTTESTATTAGGFAAVETEFVVRVGVDADPDKTSYFLDEALALVGDVHIGVEIAGSPMAAINDIGPLAVASDFGNNAGLILGPVIADWRAALDGIEIESCIDGALVGQGRASSLPGGPMASLRFLAEHCARRGRPLTAGQLISTGAATGVHDIRAGQSARLVFSGAGEILCRAVSAHAG